MTDLGALLAHTAAAATRHLDGIDERPVHPRLSADDLRARIPAVLGDEPIDPTIVVDELVAAVTPGLVASPGGRYFGFVTGSALPAALAADWLTSAWDQNAFSYVSSPAASVVEEVTARWLLDLLRLPVDASVAFVTGCQMAHVTALAAARHEVLRRARWDLPRRGLAGAPPVRIVTGAQRHVTVDRAIRLLGIGSEAIVPVDVDGQGRMLIGALADALGAGDDPAAPTIVVAQVGEVNTGSFDPLAEVIPVAHRAGAWVHVDGAFGIWARVSPLLDHHVDGLEQADSWAFDAHKWLNVPYDSGVAVVADPEPHRVSMLGAAAYLAPSADLRDAYDWTPDASRRARGFAVHAALRSLGRRGLIDLIERCCAHARRFATGLAELPGAEILNDVELNQVLFRFGDDADTHRVLAAVQGSGVAWMGGTRWQGREAIRVSVSSWATTENDVDRTIAAFAAACQGR